MSEPQSHPLSQDSSCAIGVGELELTHLTDVDSLTFLDLAECAMFTKSERRLVKCCPSIIHFVRKRCGHGVTMV
jgi:hypothetical protein